MLNSLLDAFSRLDKENRDIILMGDSVSSHNVSSHGDNHESNNHESKMVTNQTITNSEEGPLKALLAGSEMQNGVCGTTIIEHMVTIFNRMQSGEWNGVRPDAPTYGILMRAMGILLVEERRYDI